MAILGVDIGYGETKFVSNGRYGIFTTTITKNQYKRISFKHTNPQESLQS